MCDRRAEAQGGRRSLGRRLTCVLAHGGGAQPRNSYGGAGRGSMDQASGHSTLGWQR